MSHPPLVLVVDDNHLDAELAIDALSRCKVAHAVHVARGGREALEYISGCGRDGADTLPSLVLLDVKMPLLDGVEVLRKLRQDRRSKYVPVVMLTSSREERDLERCYDAGANSYLVKPVSHEEFVRTTARVLEYWLVLNAAPRAGAAG